MLGRLSTKAEAVGLFEGFSAREWSSAIPFIQFTDNSLFFIKVDVEGLRNLMYILLIVEATMGMKVNWSKSAISPIGLVPEIKKMADDLGYEIIPLPTSYLGLLLGAKDSSNVTWNPMLEKTGRKLANWKGNYVSNGGKIILLKSVLASVPIFSFPFTKLQPLLFISWRGCK